MLIENKKLERLLACPNCKKTALEMEGEQVRCRECGASYSVLQDKPILIKQDSPVREWYKPKATSRQGSAHSLRAILRSLWRLRPEARVWTRKSQRALGGLLEQVQPDAADTHVVLVGAGFERVYRRILRPYRDIIRLGLATYGEVDVFSDVCDMPLTSNSLDLIVSSSVLEHVYNPEAAAQEMFRVVKPGGYVYAEIPFMRAYHMMPVDYQRYTISGIEELFRRQGFKLVSKGICSGPFTAGVLFFVDFWASFLLLEIITLPLLTRAQTTDDRSARFFSRKASAEISRRFISGDR